MPDPENEISDVVPPTVRQIIAWLWIALFGGRWIVISLLQWNGILTPEQTAALDENVLSRLYVVLLALTLLILALRLLRSRSIENAASDSPTAAPRFHQESRDL